MGPDFMPTHVADHDQVLGALRSLLDGGQDLSLIPLQAHPVKQVVRVPAFAAVHDGAPSLLSRSSTGAGTNESHIMGLHSARCSQ